MLYFVKPYLLRYFLWEYLFGIKIFDLWRYLMIPAAFFKTNIYIILYATPSWTVSTEFNEYQEGWIDKKCLVLLNGVNSINRRLFK